VKIVYGRRHYREGDVLTASILKQNSCSGTGQLAIEGLERAGWGSFKKMKFT